MLASLLSVKTFRTMLQSEKGLLNYSIILSLMLIALVTVFMMVQAKQA